MTEKYLSSTRISGSYFLPSGCNDQQNQPVENELLGERDTSDVELYCVTPGGEAIIPLTKNHSEGTIQFDPANYAIEVLEDNHWHAAYNDKIGRSGLG